MNERPTGQDEGQRIRSLLASVARQLARLRTGLEELGDRLQDTSDLPDGEPGRTMGELKTWLRLAIELEAKLYAFESTRRGHDGGGVEIDMDAARASIRCRLARLRRCRSARIIPE